MRDATRGGLATVLNEFAENSGKEIHLFEDQIPIREEVRGICEILGLDPLYLANEGKLIAIVPESKASEVVSRMKQHEEGKNTIAIGKVVSGKAGTVVMKTSFGGDRRLDMLVGEQLPRIC